MTIGTDLSSSYRHQPSSKQTVYTGYDDTWWRLMTIKEAPLRGFVFFRLYIFLLLMTRWRHSLSERTRATGEPLPYFILFFIGQSPYGSATRTAYNLFAVMIYTPSCQCATKITGNMTTGMCVKRFIFCHISHRPQSSIYVGLFQLCLVCLVVLVIKRPASIQPCLALISKM